MKMRKALSFGLLLAALSGCTPKPAAWVPVGENIRTSWAETLDPTSVHPEYPRPQMIRQEWQSLNGLWDYAVTPAGADQFAAADGQILVPFCLESSLSGVGRKLGADEALWYRKSISIPRTWKKKNVILHFDAVDWSTEVFVNGQRVGSHTGGYTAFAFNITPYLKKGKQEIIVKVLDATDNDFQPRGKQVSHPEGIWYTAVSGIWQSVWMEPVQSERIECYDCLADIDNGTLTLTVGTQGTADGDCIEATLVGDGKEQQATLRPGEAAVIPIENPRLWSLEDPFLYDIRMKLIRNGQVMDEVKGYTAFRKISVKEDADGHKRMALNNRILFQYGPLDQGWWPDGLYTAPSDEAMRYDLEITKEFGFNMIRKHIKVEPATWYRACDEMGILVWQDMPCFADNRKNHWANGPGEFDKGTDWPASAETKANYYKEWTEIISQLKNYPCIVTWVPFNEAWGQFETKIMAEFTKQQDPTRLVNYASGGNWERDCPGDILDSHHYPHPKLNVTEESKVNVLGEYGGIGMPVEGHVWDIDRKWGYIKMEDSQAVTDKYVAYAEMLEKIVREEGCAAAVYTQTTDVEGEINGLLTYDRKVVKLDAARVSEANRKVIDLTRE